jgi:hypothetical protein
VETLNRQAALSFCGFMTQPVRRLLPVRHLDFPSFQIFARGSSGSP